jgi:hypothetical protein
MSNPNESNAPSATTPLLDSDGQRVELTPLRVSQPSPSGQLQPVSTPVVITATPVLGTAASRPQSPNNAPTLSNEYRFVHQRIPAREGNLRFVLPGLLIAFQLAFIVIFSIFGSYSVSSRSGDLLSEQISRKYPSKSSTLFISSIIFVYYCY